MRDCKECINFRECIPVLVLSQTKTTARSCDEYYIAGTDREEIPKLVSDSYLETSKIGE